MLQELDREEVVSFVVSDKLAGVCVCVCCQLSEHVFVVVEVVLVPGHTATTTYLPLPDLTPTEETEWTFDLTDRGSPKHNGTHIHRRELN